MPFSTWVSYVRADHLTLYPSMPLASYFCAVQPLGELFSCRPFNCPSIHPSLWRVIFVPSMSLYVRVDHLILHPSILLASYFAPSTPWVSYVRADHVTLYPSIPLASYFCAVHPLGKLFSCLPFNSPPMHHPVGELFSCHPSLGRVIFLPIILLSTRPSSWRVIFLPFIPWASYSAADYLLSPFGELFLSTV